MSVNVGKPRAGFRDDERWAAIAAQSDARLGSQAIVFPRLQALQLAYQTLTLAWTIARANLEGACLIFGMTRKSARVIAKAGIQTMHQRKIERGDWAEGKVWRRAPDGRVMIDLTGYQKWAESQ
jgi:hypothetical protein